MSNDVLHFTAAGMRRGATRIAAVAAFSVPFGVAFGVAASERGLSAVEGLIMSVGIFSGSAQFAVLDLWDDTISLPSLIAVALAVNARHVLMSASLYPWVEGVRPIVAYTSFAVLSDPNYVDTLSARREGERDLGFLVGGGVALWVAWVAGTCLGLLSGDVLPDPHVLGLDVVMVSFFAAMLGGAWASRVRTLPWVAAALGTGLAWVALPDNWHLIVGGLSGGLAGAFDES